MAMIEGERERERKRVVVVLESITLLYFEKPQHHDMFDLCRLFLIVDIYLLSYLEGAKRERKKEEILFSPSISRTDARNHVIRGWVVKQLSNIR